MTDLTGALSVLVQLKLNASVQLSGDQTVGYNHHHSRDEEQSEQQQHIPGKTARVEREREKQRREKTICREEREKAAAESEFNQPLQTKPNTSDVCASGCKTTSSFFPRAP